MLLEKAPFVDDNDAIRVFIVLSIVVCIRSVLPNFFAPHAT